MTWIWQTSHSFTNAKSNFSVKFYDSSVQLNRIGVSTHILGDVVTLRDSFGLAFCHRDHFTNGLCEWHLENQHYRHRNSNRENRKPKYLQIKKRSWQTICQSILCILKAPECPHRRAWVGLGTVPPRPPSPHIRQPTSRGWSTPWQGVWTSRQADDVSAWWGFVWIESTRRINSNLEEPLLVVKTRIVIIKQTIR